MVADAFDDRGGAGVADGKALAGDAVEEDLAAGGAIEHDVADEDVLLGQEAGVLRRIDDDAPAGESLADVVVGVAFQLERDAVGERMRRSSGRPSRGSWKRMVSSGKPAEP